MSRHRPRLADVTPAPAAPEAGRPVTARRRSWLRIVLPLLVLALGVAGAVALLAYRPEPQTRPPRVLPPLVRVQTVTPATVQLDVAAQGTVTPSTESELVAEVAGRIVEVAPEMVAGGFFQKGDLLLRIDPRDYEVALRSAAAQVERWRSELALARTNRERREVLAEEGVVSPALLDEARNAERVARAALAEARSALARARLDLERTELRAPFTSLVREERVDVGQFVGRGTALGRLFATDFAEVVLPIPNEELAYLDVPAATANGAERSAGPRVTLRGRVAGRESEWSGRIVRTEGAIDARTRLVKLVARVEDPYGLREGASGPALPVGLFVHAEIEGRRLEDVFVVPRAAMRSTNQVLTVGDGERLRFRRVHVARADRERVIVDEGLVAGDRVVVSPLEAAVEGMQVRPAFEGEGAEGKTTAVERTEP